MARKKMVVQFGMGTSIRSEDYTQAAARAVRDALWHHSLNVAEAFGFPKEAMIIEVEVAVPRPELVDPAPVLAVFPYGQPTLRMVKGGLDVPKRHRDGFTVIAHAAVSVSFEMEPAHV